MVSVTSSSTVRLPVTFTVSSDQVVFSVISPETSMVVWAKEKFKVIKEKWIMEAKQVRMMYFFMADCLPFDNP